MEKMMLENLLDSEMENIKGGTETTGTCICENGGAGQVVIIEPTTPPWKI
ncbi:MAG: hypothetical protein IJ290_06820 [Bacteroidaceae bacterium]|nr:hypothetical protein [Bacteroidaceae bacterium]